MTVPTPATAATPAASPKRIPGVGGAIVRGVLTVALHPLVTMPGYWVATGFGSALERACRQVIDMGIIGSTRDRMARRASPDLCLVSIAVPFRSRVKGCSQVPIRSWSNLFEGVSELSQCSKRAVIRQSKSEMFLLQRRIIASNRMKIRRHKAYRLKYFHASAQCEDV